MNSLISRALSGRILSGRERTVMNSLFLERNTSLRSCSPRKKNDSIFKKDSSPYPLSMPLHNPSFLGGFEMEFLCEVLADLSFAV